MAYLYDAQPAQPVVHPLQSSQPYTYVPGPAHSHQSPQMHRTGTPQVDLSLYQFQQAQASHPLPYPAHYYPSTSYVPATHPQHPPYPQYNEPDRPVTAHPYSHPYGPPHASLSSRPLPRPLPKVPQPPNISQDTPPPPVPDHSSRPPARYTGPPSPASPPTTPTPSTSRALPPDPSLRRQSPHSPPVAPFVDKQEAPPVPVIAIDEGAVGDAKEPAKLESSGVPSFSFSGPEGEEDSVQQSPVKAQPEQHPSFSVNVAPPSPPKLKAVSSSPTIHELGQSQKASTTDDQVLDDDADAAAVALDSVTTLSLSQNMVCAGCNMPIGGRIVSAMKRRWHPDCFKCEACGEGLEHVAFYEAEGKPFCHVDYHERFSIRCHQCKTPIESETYVTLDDPTLGHRYYHELHFFCSECGDPFIDPKSLNRKDQHGQDAAVLAKPFVVQDGWPYCETCNIRLHKPKCAGCKQPIQDEQVLGALGKQWHEDCFVCHNCKQPFEDSFLLRKDDPYCEPCYRVALRSDV